MLVHLVRLELKGCNGIIPTLETPQATPLLFALNLRVVAAND